MPSDQELRAILGQARTIAVVGLSSDPKRPSHRVAAYLKSKGYRIVRVNPNEDEVLGERSYPSLRDVPGDVPVPAARGLLEPNRIAADVDAYGVTAHYGR